MLFSRCLDEKFCNLDWNCTSFRLNFKGEAETMFRRIDVTWLQQAFRSLRTECTNIWSLDLWSATSEEDDSGFLTLYEAMGCASDSLFLGFRSISQPPGGWESSWFMGRFSRLVCWNLLQHWRHGGCPKDYRCTCGCDVHLLLVSKVAQLRGSLVELGPIEGEKRIFKKQKSAVPPAEAWQELWKGEDVKSKTSRRFQLLTFNCWLEKDRMKTCYSLIGQLI